MTQLEIEKAIEYFEQMVLKFPENSSMKIAKEEQEEKLRELRELKEKEELNNPGYNQEVFIKHEYNQENGIASEISGQKVINAFKVMELEIERLTKENQELNTKINQISRNNSAYQTLLQLLDFKDNQIKSIKKDTNCICGEPMESYAFSNAIDYEKTFIHLQKIDKIASFLETPAGAYIELFRCDKCKRQKLLVVLEGMEAEEYLKRKEVG